MSSFFSSNRTFMELKCRNIHERIDVLFSSNRTFMELKFEYFKLSKDLV